jgi:hypothetical protein
MRAKIKNAPGFIPERIFYALFMHFLLQICKKRDTIKNIYGELKPKT